MSKLIITVGLPRSGKTTWAKEFLKKSGNAIRINRDDIRQMLHNGKWSPRNEEMTMKIQKAMVEAGLKAGKVVVVDDTNLGDYHRARWSGIAKEQGATFEVKKMDDVSIQELIHRDKHSDSVRGSDVIVRMALETKFITFENDEIVICDLDGTLCDCEHRRHHVQTTPKNWPGFFEDIDKDSIVESTHTLLKEFVRAGKKILFVSARPENHRKKTETWLKEHNFFLAYDEGQQRNPECIVYYGLLMRPSGDSRADTLVKKNILDKYIDKKWIHVVIDDRPCIVEMWRSEGLTVIDVGDGIEF